MDRDYTKFEQLLKAKKITAYKLAKDTGLSNSLFSDWKRGKAKPKADKIQKIAEYFGVSTSYFYIDETAPKEAPPVDEAKEANSALVELARNCPEEKADLMLRLMQTVLQDEKKE